VHINDVSAAREIHKVGGRFMKSPWYGTLVPPGVRNVFSVTDPEYHGAIRRLLAAPIADSSLKCFEPVFTERVRLATDRIGEELQADGVSDVFKWWSFLATDIIGELTFGDSFRTLEYGKVRSYGRGLLRSF
jgi:cytochrome P450